MNEKLSFFCLFVIFFDKKSDILTGRGGVHVQRVRVTIMAPFSQRIFVHLWSFAPFAFVFTW